MTKPTLSALHPTGSGIYWATSPNGLARTPVFRPARIRTAKIAVSGTANPRKSRFWISSVLGGQAVYRLTRWRAFQNTVLPARSVLTLLLDFDALFLNDSSLIWR